MSVSYWYVLASDGERFHRDLAITSARVLRYVSPDCTIALAADSESLLSAARDGVTLSDVFDDVRCDECSEPTALQRSRSIKIRLRLWVPGDFVYLDSDTLAVRPIGSFPLIRAIGMAFDYAPGHSDRIGPSEALRSKFDQIGWDFPVPRYFNAGVIAWKDCQDAQTFAEAWYTHWRRSVAAGIPQDQLALNHTDRERGGLISPLQPEFNAQVRSWPGFARRAAIWHFFHSHNEADAPINSILDLLFDDVQANRPLNLQAFERARARHFPWVKSQGFAAYVATGNYFAAARELPLSLRRFLARRLSLPSTSVTVRGD